ncbi:MAG: ArsB/NhaD family transporter [Armatimonadetes bacterium]|nr:ArsB/NhaD family transporter [Armatimonadota bacterium]
MTAVQLLACGIFLAAYILIASERVDKSVASLTGATLMLLVRLLSQEEAFHGTDVVHGVDWNTILLLVGMMIVVAITKETGVFEWMALKSAKVARGRPWAILALICLVTAVISALLDNVTTVLLIAPVVVILCRTLEVSAVPFLVCCALSSNIGGTATLIGDPPNIMIGSAGHLTFLDFLKVDLPIIALVFPIFLLAIWAAFGRKLHVDERHRLRVLEFDESKAIHDWPLLRKCLIVIVLTLAGFTIHGAVGLEPATIALAGACLILILYGKSPVKVLEEVEWPTIFFFMGLFIMVGGLVKVGVISMMANAAISLTGGSTPALAILLLWFSALFSGVVGNIPATVALISLILDITHSVHGAGNVQALHSPEILPLWWALSLGACLGGNLTLVGAPANAIVVGISGAAGHPVRFVEFLKYGVPLTLLTLVVAMGCLWVAFLR